MSFQRLFPSFPVPHIGHSLPVGRKILVLVGAYVKYVMSTVSVGTVSGTLVDDTEASLSFTLDIDCEVLIIYNVSNKHGSVEYFYGKYGMINIDDVDIAESRAEQSPYTSNYKNGFTCLWVGALSAGAHTVKGRFASIEAGQAVSIDQRQLIVLAIPEAYEGSIRGVMSTISVSTTSGTLVDDTEAIYSFTLDKDRESIILYQGSSRHGAAEINRGKWGTVNVDGVDETVARGDQSPMISNYANSFTSAHSELLAAGSHTVKGRFASHVAGSTVTINQRQLAIIAVPPEFPIFRVASSTRVATTSEALVDDIEASLSFDLTEDSLVIIIYNSSSDNDDRELGRRTSIQVDGVDKAESEGGQSCYGLYPNGCTSLWVGTLTAGSHTVKGRFATNYAGYEVAVEWRELIVLAIPIEYLL